MDDPQTPQPPSQPNRFWWLLGGMLAGNAAAAGLFLSILGLMKLPPMQKYSTSDYGFPSLLFVCLAGGFVAAAVWRRLKLTMGGTALHSFTTTLIGLGGAAIFLREGAVCLIIAAPIYYVVFLIGAEIGRRLFRPDNRLRLSVIPCLFVVAALELATRTRHEGAVIDELRIAAPPEKVWPHVLAFRDIQEPPDFWLFRIGLPYPVATTNTGNFVGADRACIFSSDAVFREKVAELIPRERLTFDIVESPPHPELMGHIDAQRGQFVLRDNGDGTTTLIGTTWYSLHVRPASYFDAWTHHLLRAVHLRVMNHVKRLAENEP